ncbi:hypothetical protein Poli38472_014836 [Pythium oligandrum]|uniref:Uncharacterized protein n=1 Tax=Pythium oligandrum TaxID=41045 RepID=A0A8K1CDN5_PYTOL|nr:hypothetical protein Poli38472_014836 [Pythium oligandrum]|eukprot:TMW60971.1 hypothetical protein Poli38472_014836 [Pythium oligandrum]
MDALGNVLREVIVRKGLKGYSDDERPGRLTLLYEGTTLAKMLLLMFVIYNYYFVSIFGDDNVLRLVSTTGFFLAIALSLLPLLIEDITELVSRYRDRDEESSL